MSKNNKNKNLGIYDSYQELYFASWLEDLKSKGLVLDYQFNPDPFILSNKQTVKWNKQLKTKQKELHKSLLSPVSYTTDFKIVWNPKVDGLLIYKAEGVYNNISNHLIYSDENNVSYIEIKPSFNYQNMNRHVRIKIAWVYQLYNIYVQIIDPIVLFKSTFYPNRYMYTDSKKSLRRAKVNGVTSNISEHVKTIDKYYKELTNNPIQ